MTALLLAATWLSLAADRKSEPKSIPELQAAIEAVLKETKTPGAAVAIVSSDKVEWMAGIGKANVAANKPVTANTLFRIGSVSKSFAALALGCLANAERNPLRADLGFADVVGQTAKRRDAAGAGFALDQRRFAGGF